MTTSRTFTSNDTLPELYIPYPKCGHCFTEVQIQDDWAWCEECRVQWKGTEDGVAADPDENIDGTNEKCGEIAQHLHRTDYVHDGKRWQLGTPRPCILPASHTSPHQCPYEVTTTEVSS